jgi:hypothetical protein
MRGLGTGFTEQQAEALAEAEAELFEAHLATKKDLAKLEHQAESIRTELKRDLAEVRAELKRDIAEVQHRIEEVRAELKRDLKDLEYRLVIKLGAMLVVAVAVGVVAALVKLL